MTRSLFHFGDGTAQDARHSVALEDHYIDVDDRTLDVVIANAAEAAKSVRFYDSGNRIAGNWNQLFNNDEAVVMADIVATDTARMEAEFDRASQASVEEAASYLVHFAQRVEHWYSRLDQAGQSTRSIAARRPRQTTRQPRLETSEESVFVMGRQIEMIVRRKVTGALGTAIRFHKSSDHERLRGLFRHNMWQLDAPPQESTEPPESQLREAFYSMVSAVSYIVPLAKQRFARSLESGDHDPALGLFIAFARLLDVPRGRLNRFTARHRDFYYDTVLGIRERPPSPDSTFLVLAADPAATPLLVPAGTQFTAGKPDGGVEIILAADTDIAITDARIRALCTLHCAHDAQVSPECQLGYVNGLRKRVILSPDEPSAAPSASDFQSWPLLGAGVPGLETSLGEDAGVGFAFSSSALMLREGDREISVTLTFAIPRDVSGGDASPNNSFGELFRRMILGRGVDPHSFAKEAEQLKFTSHDLLLQDPEYVFYRVVQDAFQVSVTTAGEWYTFQNYTVSRPQGQGAFRQLCFTMSVGSEAPPFSPWSAADHGPGFNTGFPVLKFTLNPGANIYSYSLFCDLAIREVSVKSTVSEATGLLAWNQFGQLDTSKPFSPFGPLPTTNSYLIFGDYDAARMNLTEMTATIEWGDLPDIAGGFPEYYKIYGADYSNDAFVADLSTLCDGRWRPGRDEAEIAVPLFDIGAEGGKPASVRKIGFDVRSFFKRIDPAVPEDQFRYDQKARGGFFRIDLAGPEGAFGHREYPSLLTRALSGNAQTRWLRRREEFPLPYPPYTPVIDRMTINYTAVSSIKAGAGTAQRRAAAADVNPFEERFYLMHPFSVETVDTQKSWNLLPLTEFNGNLFIGFSASDPSGPLTLLFHLREDSVSGISLTPEPVFWSYLSGDEWAPLSEGRVLSDTTDGFLSSGIVTLDLPDDMDLAHTVMPGSLYWLRVSARRNFQSFCTIYTLSAQAVSVTRLMTGTALSRPAKPVPPNSIKGPVSTIFGLRSVLQPIATAGGRQPEDPKQKVTRSSERLRHKARAVTPWDHERLVLEEFPEVFKVKCFPAMSSQGKRWTMPGSVLIVVVPWQTEHESGIVFDPMLDAIRLKRIQKFLGDHASPHVRIEVRNPAYDRILVRCKVRFAPKGNRQRGNRLTRLTEELKAYISPWSKTGPTPRFGWTFQKDAVEAFIREQEDVESVSSFSMLHLSEDESAGPDGDEDDPTSYRLRDTARNRATQVRPRYPWSLAVPNETQIIEAWDDPKDRVVIPVQTGIGKLEIGNTMVIE